MGYDCNFYSHCFQRALTHIMIKEWLKRTRSLRHDIYEVLIWIVGISIVIYYCIK